MRDTVDFASRMSIGAIRGKIHITAGAFRNAKGGMKL